MVISIFHKLGHNVILDFIIAFVLKVKFIIWWYKTHGYSLQTWYKLIRFEFVERAFAVAISICNIRCMKWWYHIFLYTLASRLVHCTNSYSHAFYLIISNETTITASPSVAFLVIWTVSNRIISKFWYEWDRLEIDSIW